MVVVFIQILRCVVIVRVFINESTIQVTVVLLNTTVWLYTFLVLQIDMHTYMNGYK